MRILGLGAIAAAAMVLAGCDLATYDVIEIRDTEASGGTAFTQALTREYRELALWEADVEYDWIDADKWAEKGLAAAVGEVPAPEFSRNWQRSTDDMDPARERMMGLFADTATEKFPAAAARAQVQYDCWLEEQDEAWQTERIEGCRDNFLQALATIEDGMKPPPAPMPAPKPIIKVEPAPPPPQPMSFIVFFDFDSATITPPAGRILDDVAAAYRDGKKAVVALDGHADRSGSNAYNQRLSERRAGAAKAALVTRGVPVGAIATAAFGETRPRVATADGVRQQENRRVEIEIR